MPAPPPLPTAKHALRLIPRLYRWAVASTQANHLGRGLSLRQLGVLYALREGVTSPGQLARRLRVTPAVVTGLLDRLERNGHVLREAEAGDRRRSRLLLTDTGREVSLEVHQALASQLAAQFTSASPEELQELERSLSLVERALVALEKSTSLGPEDEEAPARKRRT